MHALSAAPALLNFAILVRQGHGQRRATCCCSQNTELFVVDIQDFKRILQPLQQDTLQSKIAFLQKVSILPLRHTRLYSPSHVYIPACSYTLLRRALQVCVIEHLCHMMLPEMFCQAEQICLQVPVFKSLPANVVESLAVVLTEKILPPRSVIYYQGSEVEDLFFVQRGHVKV